MELPVSEDLQRPVSHSTGRVTEDHDDVVLSKPLKEIDQEELIDMTAMVDIVFFLLIFFLVTSMSATHSSMPIPVPESKDAGRRAAPTVHEIESSGDSVIVRINREDRVEIDGVVVADLSDLPAIFQQHRRKIGANLGLLVIGHNDASHGKAVAVLDAGYEAGIDRIRLAVSDSDADPD